MKLYIENKFLPYEQKIIVNFEQNTDCKRYGIMLYYRHRKEGTLQCTSKHKAFLQKVGCINKCLNRLPSNQHGGVTLHIDVSVIGRNTTVMNDLLSLGNRRPSRKKPKAKFAFRVPEKLTAQQRKVVLSYGK